LAAFPLIHPLAITLLLRVSTLLDLLATILRFAVDYLSFAFFRISFSFISYHSPIRILLTMSSLVFVK
jgi:hypothetical protein